MAPGDLLDRPLLKQTAFCTVVAMVVAATAFGLLRSVTHHRTASAAALQPGTFASPSPRLPGILPPLAAAGSGLNVYAAAMATTVRPDLTGVPERVYVPDSGAASLEIIDPKTYQVVGHLQTGQLPFHITPSWDLSRLYVDNEQSGTLQTIDPLTSTLLSTVSVPNPYNLYFTPDGSTAIVVDERTRRLVFADPHTWEVRGAVDIPSPGVDHLDFSADGGYLLASCEWSGTVVKVDVKTMALVGAANVGGLPIDVRLSPDGSLFYVANQGPREGVSIIDPIAMKEVGFLTTGRGAHGLQVSRDARRLYVSNRLAGTISVIDFPSHSVVATWHTGGSPDMMQISPSGRELWVSARYDRQVYVVDTVSGAVTHRIVVGASPHGLVYFPNPGRFSLGHNGVYR